jgi:hypothetical protein
MRVCPSRARRWRISGAAGGLFLLLAGVVSAQTDADELARRHFDSGVAYLAESDLENALKAFEKAYGLSKRPTILLNIASVHERRGDTQAAITALRGYLDAEPAGEHAETTKLRLQNLEKRAAESPPAPPPTPPAAEPAPAAPAAPAAAPPPPPAAPPAPESAPAPNRIPAYVAFGVGGAGVVAAVITGLIANGEYQSNKDACSPNCSDDEVSTGRTMALVSTIATGVAVVGAGVGLTLILMEPGATATTGSSGARPGASVSFGLAGDGVRGSASFRF